MKNFTLLVSAAAIFSSTVSIYGDTSSEQPDKVEFNPATIMRGERDLSNDRLVHKIAEHPADIDDSWTEITPEYFEFHNLPAEYIEKMVSVTPTPSDGGFSGTRTTDWVKETAQSDGCDLSKGMIFLAGKMLHREEGRKTDETEWPRVSIKKGLSVFDFGDEVGNVLMYCGSFSRLRNKNRLENVPPYYEDVLPSSYYYKDLEDRITLEDIKGGFIRYGGYQDECSLFFFPVDSEKYFNIVTDETKTYTIRVQVEYNIHQNVAQNANRQIVYPALTANAVGDLTGILGCYGWTIRSDTEFNTQPNPTEGPNIGATLGDGPFFKDNNPDNPEEEITMWRATDWITLETNLIIRPFFFNGTNAKMTDAIPCVRLQLPSHNINNMSYMFRNVRMYVKEGEVTASENGYIPEIVRRGKNKYLLRPSEIEVRKQKIYVDEPATLSAIVKPTWATRDVRWVLVDNEGKQYQSLGADLPSEIADYVESFDGATGKITMKKNGTVKVQAISVAEGKDKDGVEVKKVMSSVTELPVFDVVHGITINHDHHIVDSNAGLSTRTIELSGSESTRVEYVLNPKSGVENPKFDPDTPLSFSIVSSNYADIDKSAEIHGRSFTTDKYDGNGAFDVSVSADAIMSDAQLVVKVNDGRETWPMYTGVFTARDGIADLKHYGRPTHFRIHDEYTKSDASCTLSFYDDNMRIAISNNGSYTLTPQVKNTSDTDNTLHAKQLMTWELAENGNDLLDVVNDGNGNLILTPKAFGVTKIKFTSMHAGEHKSAQLAPTMSAMSYPIAMLSSGDTPSDEHNTVEGEPIYEPYGPVWASNFMPAGNFDGSTPVNVEQTLIVEINGSGLSSIHSAEFENPDDSYTLYYNLQGVRTENVDMPGTYIRIRNGKAEKITVRN